MRRRCTQHNNNKAQQQQQQEGERRVSTWQISIVTDTRVWQLRADSANTQARHLPHMATASQVELGAPRRIFGESRRILPQDVWIRQLMGVCGEGEQAKAPAPAGGAGRTAPAADATSIAAAELKMQARSRRFISANSRGDAPAWWHRHRRFMVGSGGSADFRATLYVVSMRACRCLAPTAKRAGRPRTLISSRTVYCAGNRTSRGRGMRGSSILRRRANMDNEEIIRGISVGRGARRRYLGDNLGDISTGARRVAAGSARLAPSRHHLTRESVDSRS